ncbi:MAG: GNAT family N-acetyltransferase [Chloroflexaceae bacterium]|nr:GNAT family N-acetyltransferase [Chloroflexaceae bacterium]
MMSLRPLHWPSDCNSLLGLDTSFTTDRIYQVVSKGLSFTLEESEITPSLHKAYDLEVERLPEFDYVVVCEVDSHIAGLAALKYEEWSRRAILWHFYMHPTYRGRGVGRALMDDAVQAARQMKARCMWLETQNVNYGAIQFYQKLGFQLCGLDLSLYDPQEVAGETALFFVRRL